MPIVTVLMPVYNGAAYLREAIDSILHQTYRDFEFLIINDGSTDKSEDIILSYHDDRIKYIKNETNIKLIATLNRGIQKATGKYIVRMDADDISLPSRIKKQVAFMDTHPQIAVCGSWFEGFGAKESIVKYEEKHADIMYKMLYQCHLCHPSLILRKTQIQSLDDLFNPDFAHAEDYDFFVRVGYQFELANLQETLLRYRIHPNSVSAKYKSIQDENSKKIKRGEFNRIGYNITDQEIHDFDMLNYNNYEEIKSNSTHIRLFLENLIKSNQKSQIFDHSLFNKKISALWFHYCYQAKTAKEYNSSKVLSHYIKPTFMQHLKWLLRKKNEGTYER